MDVLSMSNAEIDAALKAAGPIGVWAADWIAKKEHALGVAQDQAMSNGAQVQRLTEALAAYEGYLSYERSQVERLRAILEKIAANDHLTSVSPVGPAHGAGVSFGLEWNAKIAREALAVASLKAPVP